MPSTELRCCKQRFGLAGQRRLAIHECVNRGFIETQCGGLDRVDALERDRLRTKALEQVLYFRRSRELGQRMHGLLRSGLWF